MSSFYVKINDKKSGPYDATKLKQPAGAGETSQDELVAPDGETNWVTGDKATGLFSASTTRNSEVSSKPAVKSGGRGILRSLAGAAEAVGNQAVAFVADPGFLTRRRRIAITGLAATGKTVFLTTLINHLKYHDASQFRLFGEAVTAKLFTEKDLNDGLERFDHSVHAKAMQTGRWPQKTVDVSSYACGFKTNYHWVDYQVEFLDWPGERIADVSMYKCDYAAWSDHLLKYWEVEEERRYEHVAPYLAALQQDRLSEASILVEFRLALARSILGYNPFISPSCFLLGRDGRRLRGTSAEQLADTGIAGLSNDAQFAPLPKEVRKRQTELAAMFAQRYAQYREQVICSLVGGLAGCNRLIVLLDIPAILASGVGMLNDNCEMVEQMLAGFDARAGLTKRLIKRLWEAVAPAMWMWPGIEKIAFVANKADLVAGPVNRDNMLGLLKEMLRSVVSKIDGVEIGYFVASAVNSTKHAPDQSDDGNRLIGKPLHDEQGRRLPPSAPEQSFCTSSVPKTWPERRWLSGEFTFPDVYPALPPGNFQLPKHIDLDKVFQFILD